MFLLFAALAHVGDVIDSLGVHTDPVRPGVVHVEGTFGLVTLEGDALRWVCHEAVTAPGVLASPRYAQGSDGRFAAWNLDPADGRDGHPVWSSDDRCQWDPVLGLEGRRVAQVSVRGSTIWAATADDATPNGLYRAAGDTFEPVLTLENALFLSVRADGPAVWALSTDGQGLTLWHSPDGQHFVEHALPVPDELAPPVRGWIAAVDPDDTDRAWLVLDPVGADRLYAVTADGSTALLWDPGDRITRVATAPDGTLYAILNDRRPHRYDGERFVELPLEDASGLHPSEQGLWLSHRAFVSGVLLSHSPDGIDTDRHFAPWHIEGPATCPAGSTQATVCTPLWDTLAPRLQPPDTGLEPRPPTPVVEAPPGRCGCSHRAPGGALLPAFLVLRSLRRRSDRPG